MDERTYTVDGSDDEGWFILSLAGERIVVCETKGEGEKLVQDMNELKRIADASGTSAPSE